MHVLILSTGYPTDYVPLDGIFYRDQAEALVTEGVAVGFIAINPVSVKSIIRYKKLSLGFSSFNENGVNTFLYKYINIPKYPSYCVKQARKKGVRLIEKYIAQFGKPDVVHLHCYEAVLMAIYLKQKYNIPFVITEHSFRFMNNLVPVSMEKYAEMAFRESGYNISVSKKFAEVLNKKYNSMFHYVPNVVDTALYRPDISSKGNNVFTFLSAGILNDNKNHQLLLAAFKLFISSGRKAKLLIAGDGPNADKLKSMSRQLRIMNDVTFLGWLTREDLSEKMKEINVFVLPSKKETFGVVLIEAMSCGIPVISTKSGGPESIIDSDKIGVLCSSDEKNLFLAMAEVYDNFTSYKADEIRQVVLDTYSQKAVAKQLISIYKTLLKKND
ncbi:MAG: glycosyltransferase [Bacteroidota bacterium]